MKGREWRDRRRGRDETRTGRRMRKRKKGKIRKSKRRRRRRTRRVDSGEVCEGKMNRDDKIKMKVKRKM